MIAVNTGPAEMSSDAAPALTRTSPKLSAT